MKTKEYLFSQEEVTALREASISMFFLLRDNGKENVRIAKVLKSLADQFKEDVRLWKE